MIIVYIHFFCGSLKAKEDTFDKYTHKVYYSDLDHVSSEEYFLDKNKIASSTEEFQNYKLLV